MKAFVLENNLVVNIIEIDDNDTPSNWGAVQLTSLVDFTAIGDTIVDGVSVEAATREADYQAALVSQPPE
jgi:hypothetical protein